MEIVEFRSLNFRDHFIRHKNFLGELTRKEGPAEDFLFALVPRGQQGQVALRSKNFPKLFLRHRDFRLRLEGPNGLNDQLFTKDSTFFLLFVEPEDSANLAPDATFFKEFASVPIDPGTILVPADN